MIFEIGQLYFLPQFLPCSVKKFGELWSTNHGELVVKLYPSKSFFRETIFRSLRGAAPPHLYTLENDQVLLAHTPLVTGVPLTIFSKGVQNWLRFQQLCTYNLGGRGSIPTVTMWHASRLG